MLELVCLSALETSSGPAQARAEVLARQLTDQSFTTIGKGRTEITSFGKLLVMLWKCHCKDSGMLEYVRFIKESGS